MNVATQATVRKTGWPARLALRFVRRGGRTVLADRRHYGPLRVQRPFYPESPAICHVYVLHPPAGMVSGDDLEMDVRVGGEAWGLITTPGAGKFYRHGGGPPASQDQRLSIAAGGTLEWLPQENILYDGAHACMATRVEVEEGARFMGWDITCLGRPACDEALRRCRVRQRFELWRDGVPLWVERSRYDDHCPVLDARWGLRGQGVAGTLVCTNHRPEVVDEIRRRVEVAAPALFSATQMDEVLVCRYLGGQAQEARACLGGAWRLLRRLVFGREAVPPRIWLT